MAGRRRSNTDGHVPTNSCSRPPAKRPHRTSRHRGRDTCSMSASQSTVSLPAASEARRRWPTLPIYLARRCCSVRPEYRVLLRNSGSESRTTPGYAHCYRRPPFIRVQETGGVGPFRSVWFSKHGTLLSTVQALVEASEGGYYGERAGERPPRRRESSTVEAGISSFPASFIEGLIFIGKLIE